MFDSEVDPANWSRGSGGARCPDPDGSGDIQIRIRDVADELEMAARVSAASLSGTQLLDSLISLDTAQRFLDATRAHLLLGVMESGASDDLGHTPASWFAHISKTPSSRSRQCIRIAQRLRDDLPTVDTALTSGRISWSHAEVFHRAVNARNLDMVSLVAEWFCSLATEMPFNRWKQELLDFARQCDFDGTDPGGEERNSLSFAASDSFTTIKCELTADNAAAVQEAVETVADELFRRYKADHELCDDIEIPGRSTLRALALVEICRRAMSVEVGSSRVSHPEVAIVVGPENFGVGVTRHGNSINLSGSVAFCAPDLITVLTDEFGNPVASGPGLPFPQAEPSAVVPEWFDNSSDEFFDLLPESWSAKSWLLNRGRELRWATASQRRALAARDGGCVFPGCEAPHAWTDAHHVHYWEHGGATDLNNLISLCRRHHGVAHRSGWEVHLDPDGVARWITPSGEELLGQRHHRLQCDRGSPASTSG